MGQQALRVLALALRHWEAMPDDISPETVEADMVFVGFAGMIDPPRPEVKDAVKEAKLAGIPGPSWSPVITS